MTPTRTLSTEESRKPVAPSLPSLVSLSLLAVWRALSAQLRSMELSGHVETYRVTVQEGDCWGLRNGAMPLQHGTFVWSLRLSVSPPTVPAWTEGCLVGPHLQEHSLLLGPLANCSPIHTVYMHLLSTYCIPNSALSRATKSKQTRGTFSSELAGEKGVVWRQDLSQPGLASQLLCSQG